MPCRSSLGIRDAHVPALWFRQPEPSIFGSHNNLSCEPSHWEEGTHHFWSGQPSRPFATAFPTRRKKTHVRFSPSMATNALLRTPSSLYRIRTCSTIALSLLPRRPIATKHHASTLPPKQPRRSNGQFLAGCAVATTLWTALWLCLRSSKDETAHDTAQDADLTDQELE